MESTARKLAVSRSSVLVGGRPAPPRPPTGPISRVQSSLLMRQPAEAPPALGPRVPFGLPSLRRNVCPNFYMTSARGPIPITAPHLLKALMRQDSNTARCQLRGGVHLEQGYVSDICLSS
ncbi:MAG TPA: hypothetical protein VH741_04970, partial [Candidatus Limnocylindrales bacterium]